MPSSSPQPALSRAILLVFSMPAIMQGFMHAPAISLVQGIYAKHAGLPLVALGTAVLLTRMFDAVTDPLIGWLSDLWHRKTGTRKPFIVLGTFVTVLGLWFLYRPPDDVTISYFTVWFLIAYLGWTMTEIPYRAWSFELSSEYVMRTKIQSWLGLALQLGTLCFFFVPFITKMLGRTETTEINLNTLAFAALIVVFVMPLMNLIAVTRIPNGEVRQEVKRISFRELIRAITENGPLLYFNAMFLAIGVASGLGQGVLYLFLDGYLGIGEQLAGILILAVPAGLIGIPVWSILCQRYERQKVWSISIVLTGLAYVGMAFVPQGEAGLIPAAVLSVMQAFCGTCVLVAGLAMMGDIVDYGRWKFGQDHAALYLSLYTLLQKAIGGIGVALGFIILDYFSFDATAKEQTSTAVFGMKLVISYLPGIAMMILATAVWFFPITRTRHEELMQDIKARGQSN